MRINRLLVAALVPSGLLMAQPQLRSDLDAADALYRRGQFADAETLYADIVARDGGNLRAVLQLGRLALFTNRFDRATEMLDRALRTNPSDREAKVLLAETHYRQDHFSRTAALLRGTGDDLKVRVLDGFEALAPYRIDGDGEETRLPFVQTDPIPVVRVRVNGREAHFIIDTGASEVYLEPEFAKSIGAVIVTGSESAGFAGGQKRPVQKGRIDSLGLGGFTVRNLPVNIVDTKFIGRDEVARGLQISGFLGTVLFYHFLPTIDYLNGELVLRRKTAARLKRFEAEASREGQGVIPFWMVNSHLMVTWGSAHRSPSKLFLIDTGGAGVGFVPGPSFIKEAGIQIPSDSGQRSVGALSVRFFTTDEVAVGSRVERDIPSVLGPFPATMEEGLGFHLAGIISHEYFKRYALTIDFVGMRFFLKPRT